MTGSVKATTINNLNLNDDVVRWDRITGNIIRAEKQFETIHIDRLNCQFGCSIQDVNVAEWITKSVFTTLRHNTIQGKVIINNPVMSHVDVFGDVNDNGKFNSKTILLKNTPQKINGTLIIGNRESSDTIVQSLTFDNIYVNFINGRNFSEFHTNLVKRNQNNEIVADIFTNMQFTQPLTIDNLNNVDLTNSSNLVQISHIDQKTNIENSTQH